MQRKKGFTLIEIIVCLLLLAIVAIVIGTSIAKTKDNRTNMEWESTVDRIVSGTEQYIENKYQSYMTNEGDMFVPINSLILDGLIDEKELIDLRDNTKIVDKKDEKFKYVRVFINENESIEYEYPVKALSYIKIKPRIKIVNMGTAENLVDIREVSICNKDNVCNSTNNNSIITNLNNIELTNKTNYAFNKQNNYTLSYIYNGVVSYRFYKVVSSECKLALNVENSDNLFLSLLGKDIKQYQLEIDGEIQNINNYTPDIIKTFTPKELSNINNIKVKCYYESIFAQTKSDSIDVEYDYNPTYPELIKSYKCLNITHGIEPFIFNYTGNCEVINDGNDNWKVKLLTSGNISFSSSLVIDAFLVGGGGGGGGVESCESTAGIWVGYGSTGGGGGGYTKTIKSIIVNNESTPVVIGNGGKGNKYVTSGGQTTAFNNSANGGAPGEFVVCNSYGRAGNGGNNGGESGTDGDCCAIETREFGEITGDYYAGGGAGCGANGGAGGGGNWLTPGTTNTGGGGGCGANGGSGVVVIRNARQ